MVYPHVQDVVQVVFGQGNHEVQALPPQHAQQTLAKRIGLGTPDWDFEDLQSEVEYTLVELLGEDCVSVIDQETVAVINRNGIAKLLDRPLGRGVRRHIGTQDSTG